MSAAAKRQIGHGRDTWNMEAIHNRANALTGAHTHVCHSCGTHYSCTMDNCNASWDDGDCYECLSASPAMFNYGVVEAI